MDGWMDGWINGCEVGSKMNEIQDKIQLQQHLHHPSSPFLTNLPLEVFQQGGQVPPGGDHHAAGETCRLPAGQA